MWFENNVLIYLAIVVISYFIWICCRRVFFIRRLNILSGPKTLPLIGNIHHIILKTPEEFLDIIFKMTEDYSSPFQFWVGSKLFIGIYEPNQIKLVKYLLIIRRKETRALPQIYNEKINNLYIMLQTILNNKNYVDKSILYELSIPLFGTESLFIAPASIWTKIRKMAAPTFSASMLQGFFNTFVEQSVIFTHELEKIGLSGNEIILLEHITNCTWRIACDSIMGITLEQHKNNQYVKAIHRLKNILINRITNILLFPNIIFNFTAVGREQKKKLNLIHSLIDEMIQQRTNELNNPNTIKNENNRTYITFFDILMEAHRKENFTREEIHCNVVTMLITASDTISVTMNFVIFMLANYPEIQEKIYKELLEIYDTKITKSAPKYDDLQHMHYLDRVIKETMRLFPPGALIGRRITEDLKMGEFVLPKGADIIIPIIKLHRDEKYWQNPLVFDPDRFLSEKIKNSHSSYYIPFSDGSRNCIGIKYAMMCMKVILATLIRTFVFKVDKSIDIDGIKLEFDTLLSPVNPLKVKIKKRYLQ